MCERVRDFLEGRISYEQLWPFLRSQGVRVPFVHAKRILERIGVKPGAFVYKTDNAVPLRCLPRVIGHVRRVFYVRAVCQTPFGNTALLLENSFPLTIEEAIRRGLTYRGSFEAGVFHFFAPQSFCIVRYVRPALVHLALSVGQYRSLIPEGFR